MKNLIIIFTLAVLLSFLDSSAQTEVAGNVSGVLDVGGSPYLITGEIHVPTDSCLRIMPGCSLIFQGHYKFCIDSNAILRAVGTAGDSIVFIPVDTILTDSSGGHHGIRFFSSAYGCSLNYCNIKYGNGFGETAADVHGGGIRCHYTDDIQISNSNISRNMGREWGGGIWGYNSNISINNSTISYNQSHEYGAGIYCSESILNITDSDISNNSVYGCQDGCGAGGGIYFRGGVFSLSSSTILGNYAPSGGGVICGHSVSIIDNIISGNSASVAGGVAIWSGAGYIVTNNIRFMYELVAKERKRF